MNQSALMNQWISPLRPISFSVASCIRQGIVYLQQRDIATAKDRFAQAIDVLKGDRQETSALPYADPSGPLFTCMAREGLYEGILQFHLATYDPAGGWEHDAEQKEIQGQINQVIQSILHLYDQAIAHSPDIANLYWDRSCLLSDQQLWHLALADLDRAIALQPLQPIFWTNRGMVQYQLSNFSSALSDFTHGIRLHPSADGYARRALTYIQQQQPAWAIADLTQAMDLAGSQFFLLPNAS